jgi:hypothetical protein
MRSEAGKLIVAISASVSTSSMSVMASGTVVSDHVAIVVVLCLRTTSISTATRVVTVGAKVVRTSEAVAGVTRLGVLTVGAKVVSVNVAVAGVISLGVRTVGANPVSVSVAVVGVTLWWAVVVTVGANVVRVSDAVAGVTTNGGRARLTS